MPKRLTDHEKIQVCIGYQNGFNSLILAKKYGISDSGIRALLRRRNISIRSHAGGDARRKYSDGDLITCMYCNAILTDDNWRKCDRTKKHKYYACISCVRKKTNEYRAKNIIRTRETRRKSSRKLGVLPMAENKKCAYYLGIYIAEQVLKNVFKNVKAMPLHNPGYDVICNQGKLIDIKSSCVRQQTENSFNWAFGIQRNQIADYFLCLAFDNREDLNPMHIWLIPGEVVNHRMSISISKGTIDKWDEYRLDIDKVITCCNIMKDNHAKSEDSEDE